MAYLGRGLDKISNIEVLDNITFDGSSSYSITKGSVAFTPNSVQSLLISIDGVVQATNFTVSSSTIDFGVAVPSTSTCNFFLHYGTGVMTVPSDGSVTSAKISYPLTTFSSTGIDDNGDQTVITIDNQERVGIRETSPISELHITDSSATAVVRLESSDTGDCRINFDDQSATDRGRIIYSHSDDSLRTEVAGSERMRIDSSGNALFGISSIPDVGDNGISLTTAGIAGIARFARSGTSNNQLLQFYNNNGSVGNISTNGSATAYNTSSDYRLKENVVEMTGATERLKQLQPKRFNFIADADTTVDGFLAHEVSSIVPEAISGTKDAVDEDGNPKYQGIDQSKLVPLLVKTIQELEARITALESE